MNTSCKVVTLDVSAARKDIADKLMNEYFDIMAIDDMETRQIELARWGMRADRQKPRFSLPSLYR